MPKLTNPKKPDALADVLKTLRLRGRVFCISELSAPWAMSLPESGDAHFHVIERGGAWLKVAGEKRAVPLASGDLVVMPHGRGHSLSDSPATKPVSLERLIKDNMDSGNHLRYGGGGVESLVICGTFQFENSSRNPLLSALPSVMHIRGGRGRVAEWLEVTLRMLADEVRYVRPGSETLVARLIDIIFIQVVRAWVEEQPHRQGGWLGALRDPQIGAALGLIHREPQRDWNVLGLANEVSMSRSPFAAKFSALVGEPPLTYLTRWRMHVAADLLTRADLSVREVATRVGYESEAAFSKAFKRQFDLSPSAYRRSTAGASCAHETSSSQRHRF